MVLETTCQRKKALLQSDVLFRPSCCCLIFTAKIDIFSDISKNAIFSPLWRCTNWSNFAAETKLGWVKWFCTKIRLPNVRTIPAVLTKASHSIHLIDKAACCTNLAIMSIVNPSRSMVSAPVQSLVQPCQRFH